MCKHYETLVNWLPGWLIKQKKLTFVAQHNRAIFDFLLVLELVSITFTYKVFKLIKERTWLEKREFGIRVQFIM